jgi:dihydroorotate dehydrogenase
MYSLLRSLLFLLGAEEAHHFTMKTFDKLVRFPLTGFIIKAIYKTRQKPVTVAGIVFPNRVGLAAGFDKNATYVDALATLGFGHIEIGTVTPLPQAGNDKPRLFRLPKDKALINRMGFNNQGMDVVANRLTKITSAVIIGGNIGKNKITPNEDATSDYEKCFKLLYSTVNYFTVNVSSPNTPNLRQLQDKEPLTALLKSLVAIRALYVLDSKPHRPIFLKIAPDLTNEQLDEIIEIVQEVGIEGIVATNTTISRADLITDATEVENIGAGGVSGAPLTQRSTEVVRYLCQKSGGKIPVIAAGGILTAADAKAKLDAGAALVQIYTGFIYSGPGLVTAINKM